MQSCVHHTAVTERTHPREVLVELVTTLGMRPLKNRSLPLKEAVPIIQECSDLAAGKRVPLPDRNELYHKLVRYRVTKLRRTPRSIEGFDRDARVWLRGVKAIQPLLLEVEVSDG